MLRGKLRANEFNLIFSHPDCTVGTGISPVHVPFRNSRAVTAGQDSPPLQANHLAPKIALNLTASHLSCQAVFQLNTAGFPVFIQ